jgi:hypothetical protein
MGKTIKSKDEYSIDEMVYRFLNLKIVKGIIETKMVSKYNIELLQDFFRVFPYFKCYDQICQNLAYFIKYDLDEFYVRLIKLRDIQRNSVDWHIIQFGEIGIQIFQTKYIINSNLKSKLPGYRTSKAAIKLFIEIDKILIDINLNVRPIYYNNDKCNEFRIKNDYGKWVCFDYTIKELNLIIEYHGEHCHPNINLSLNDWNNWKHYFSKESADIVFDRDIKHKKLAESKGFKYVVLWHSTRIKDNLNYIKSILLNQPIDESKIHKKAVFIISNENNLEEQFYCANDLKKKYNISKYYFDKILNKGLIYNGFKINKIYKSI